MVQWQQNPMQVQVVVSVVVSIPVCQRGDWGSFPHQEVHIPWLNVTGFAKRGLPHTSNLPTLTISNFRLVKVIALKFGKQEALT